MITNLQEFLSYLNADTTWDAGDILYDAYECGPWLAFVEIGGDALHSDSKGARSLTACDGVQVGSIVEGSDAEVTRAPLWFPFSRQLFEAYVQDINDEACQLWDEANELTEESTPSIRKELNKYALTYLLSNLGAPGVMKDLKGYAPNSTREGIESELWGMINEA